jgi:uncharacterized protein YggL (DUF469 family)
MTAPCPTYGFVVDVQLASHLSDADERALWDSFARIVETRGLVYAARVRSERWPCVVQSEASQATDADREAIRVWSSTHREIAGVDIGQLIDLSSPD